MRALTLAWVAGAVACGSGNAATYAGAAMVAAAAVAQTAIYRKVSGYPCWAQCQAGEYCDADAGACVRVPCGGCPADLRCERQGSVEACVPPTHHEAPDAEMCGVPDASILLRMPCDAGPG